MDGQTLVIMFPNAYGSMVSKYICWSLCQAIFWTMLWHLPHNLSKLKKVDEVDENCLEKLIQVSVSAQCYRNTL